MSYVDEEDNAGQIPEKVEEDYRASEPLLTPPSTKCLTPLSLDSLSSNVLPDSLWPPLLVFEWRERNYFDLLDLLNYISLAGLRLIWNTPFRVHLSMTRFVCLELDLYVDIAVWFRLLDLRLIIMKVQIKEIFPSLQVSEQTEWTKQEYVGIYVWNI